MARRIGSPGWARRWVMGAGGFIGEVTLVAPPPEYPSLHMSARCALLTDLYVHPLRRGRGWCTQLMQTACRYATAKELDLVLWAQPYGARKHGRLNVDQLTELYEKHGFRFANDDGDMLRPWNNSK